MSEVLASHNKLQGLLTTVVILRAEIRYTLKVHTQAAGNFKPYPNLNMTLLANLAQNAM